MSIQATVQNVLNLANINSVTSALQKVALGDFLAAFATPLTETHALSSGAITLDEYPVPGTLVVTGTHSASPVLFQEQVSGSAAANGYTISGKTLTLGSGVSGTDSIAVKYVKLAVSQDMLDEVLGTPV